jgi:hypothetical protein
MRNITLHERIAGQRLQKYGIGSHIPCMEHGALWPFDKKPEKQSVIYRE